MGPHNACRYADLAMTVIDRKILDVDKWPNDVLFPPDWSRFRDNCFSIWFESVPALLNFTEWLNSFSNSIRFTVKYSEVHIEALDTSLFIINGQIESNVYFKPTDGHMYLLPQSSHYQSMYCNIPYAVALGLRRICSRDDWFYEQLQDFKQYFRCRCYSNKIINKGFNRAINITCSDALLPKSRAPDNFKNLVPVMDYYPNFRDVPKLIKDHLQILYESPRMKKVISSNKTCIRTGFRRTKNLKDLLVPSTLPDVNSAESGSSDALGCFRCDQNVCDACHNFLLLAKRIKSVVAGKSYKISQALSCHTDYIIYCALCTLCNKQCVGSSVKFRARLRNHKSHIKQKKRTCCLVNHFIDTSPDHQLSHLKFILN